MKLLISMSFPKLQRLESPHVGRLFVPAHTGSVARTLAAGIPCAADNGAYKVFDEPRYRAMLRYLRGHDILWVAVRDVVYDAAATRREWDMWAPIVREHGLPCAYVLQNGETSANVPWSELDAVFVGGDDDWKLGGEVRALLREARARGKLRHMGRVNTLGRLRYAHRIGCNTVDGTSWAKWSDTKHPRALRLLDQLNSDPGVSLASFHPLQQESAEESA